MSSNSIKIEQIVEEWFICNEEFCKDKSELTSKLNMWISGAKQEESEILLELFAHSKYFSKSKVNNIFLDFYKNLEDVQYTIFTAIESQDFRHNSSHIYLNEFAIVSGVSEYSIAPALVGFPKKYWGDIKQIVFIDDIIGTGKTVIDFFKKCKGTIAGKKILIWVVCITEDAKGKVEEFSDENNLDIEIYAYIVEQKAFKGGYIFDIEEAAHNKLIITDLEKRLWNGKRDEFILGKKETQCLLSFYNDTPNNTLSSFWFCSDTWKPIFFRKRKEKPLWLKDKKKERTNRNYVQQK